MGPVATVRNLSVALPGAGDRILAAENVNLTLEAGKTVCIVGESGSGKSVTAFALAGLLPKELTVTSGEIRLSDVNLLQLDEPAMRRLRGAKIAMIFQEPMTALNPVLRCGDQLTEVFAAHKRFGVSERRERAIALLTEVGLPDPERAMRAFPHQLSGGQRQRVMIAMALALEPALIIADEPTTALDVTTQAQILSLLKELQRRHGTALMFITHDFGVVSEIADEVVVMRRGKIVETGSADVVLRSPRHDYTLALLAAVPSMIPPDRHDFARNPILTVKGLTKSYPSRRLFSRHAVHALKSASFELAAGETLGIVGESGSGKSTLGRCLMRLVKPTAGAIFLDGMSIGKDRKAMQMVFQDPFASLNPQKTVAQIISEGQIVQGASRATALARTVELLGLVGLDETALHRKPREFSGGQRQRIGLARALALNPRILVADEPVSALDVSMQAQVLDLMQNLRAQFGLSMVFITHDLRVAAQVCDRIAVMQHGVIVETGITQRVFADPQHPYTKSLLAAVPGQVSSNRSAQ